MKICQVRKARMFYGTQQREFQGYITQLLSIISPSLSVKSIIIINVIYTKIHKYIKYDRHGDSLVIE